MQWCLRCGILAVVSLQWCSSVAVPGKRRGRLWQPMSACYVTRAALVKAWLVSPTVGYRAGVIDVMLELP